jgi:hypothetical protein
MMTKSKDLYSPLLQVVFGEQVGCITLRDERQRRPVFHFRCHPISGWFSGQWGVVLEWRIELDSRFVIADSLNLSAGPIQFSN